MSNELYLTENIQYVANGKILLTAEYLVLDGAAGMVLPTSFGQSLSAEYRNTRYLKWTASDIRGVWFEGEFSLKGFDVIKSTDVNIAVNLQSILQAAVSLNPTHQLTKGVNISTHLNFDRLFGLGSSSTLISLVAELFGADKYKLHGKVSGGSGYDVASTSYNHPIIYQKHSPQEATIRPLNFKPPFSEQIYFIYQGNKQDTNKEISKYRLINKNSIKGEIAAITDITSKLGEVKDLTTFASLIDLHEEITGRVLGRRGIKESRFSNFEGSIKSLGAWGGDFILAVSPAGEAYIRDYFAQCNMHTVINFNNLVLNQPVISSNEVIIRF